MSDSKNEEGGPGVTTGTTLFLQAQAGCWESLNQLMSRHEILVHWVIQRRWLCTWPYEDAVQAGRQGLWRAILSYDLGRGTAFSTYAYSAMMKYVWAGVLVLYFYRTGPDPVWLRVQQQIGRVLLDLYGIGEIGRVVVGAVALLTTIAALSDTTDKVRSL